MKEVKLIWTTLLLDIAIIGMAVYVSVWQNNPRFLFLLVLLFCSGKNHVVIDNDEPKEFQSFPDEPKKGRNK